MPSRDDSLATNAPAIPHETPQVLTLADIGIGSLAHVAPVIENAKDGTLLGLVPEGEFLAGGSGSHERAFPVRLPAYYLALHCVTNAQFALFLNDTRPGQSERDKWITLDDCCFVSQAGDLFEAHVGKEEHPIVSVSWHGADAYCQWAGLRLPSELEWEKGARGVDGREFPWGDKWDKKNCVNDKIWFLGAISSVWGCPEGNSPWGLYQMSGNVWECCGDWYASDAYTRYKGGDFRQPDHGESRAMRGGSWFFGQPNFFRCAYRNDNFYQHLRSRDRYGFRCAKTI